jgi:hypothetical protein
VDTLTASPGAVSVIAGSRVSGRRVGGGSTFPVRKRPDEPAATIITEIPRFVIDPNRSNTSRSEGEVVGESVHRLPARAWSATAV